MKEGWFYLLRQRDFLNGTTDRYLKIGLTERNVEDWVKEHQPAMLAKSFRCTSGMSPHERNGNLPPPRVLHRPHQR